MRTAILGALLLSAVSFGPVAVAAPGTVDQAEARSTIPSMTATSCEAVITPRGTSLRGLPREVSARRRGADRPAVSGDALPSAEPRVLSDNAPLTDAAEAVLRPAFYLCTSDAPAPRKVLHRT